MFRPGLSQKKAWAALASGALRWQHPSLGRRVEGNGQEHERAEEVRGEVRGKLLPSFHTLLQTLSSWSATLGVKISNTASWPH